ncbi:MAG: glycine cleavage system protein H [Bdellovibrionales bacterium]|nr:glycine cleavage system protein H [Bdellovibrionales bacterium]
MSEIAPKSGEYAEGTLWFTRKNSVITVGITNAALDELGDVEGVELPTEKDDFTKDDVVATVEGSQGSIEVTTPASGVVLEINSGLTSDPSLIAEDPTEEGWLVKLEIQDKSDLKEYAGH